MKTLTLLLTLGISFTFWSCDNRVDTKDMSIEERLEAMQDVIDQFPEKEPPYTIDPAVVGEGGTEGLDKMTEYHLSIYQQALGNDLRNLEQAEAEMGRMEIWMVGKVDFGNGTQFLVTVERFSKNRERVVAVSGVQDGKVGEQFFPVNSLDTDRNCTLLPGAKVHSLKRDYEWNRAWNPQTRMFDDLEEESDDPDGSDYLEESDSQ